MNCYPITDMVSVLFFEVTSSLYSFQRTQGGRCWDGRYAKCFTFSLKDSVLKIYQDQPPTQPGPQLAELEGQGSPGSDPLTQQQRASSARPVTTCLGRLPAPQVRELLAQTTLWLKELLRLTCLTRETDNNSAFQPQFTEHLLPARLELPAASQPDKAWPAGAYVLVVNTRGVLW